MPQVWDIYNALGKALAEAGSLDAKTERFLKQNLAIS